MPKELIDPSERKVSLGIKMKYIHEADILQVDINDYIESLKRLIQKKQTQYEIVEKELHKVTEELDALKQK